MFLTFHVGFANKLQLWKRRWVEIDDYGYLILKPNGGTEVRLPLTVDIQLTDAAHQ
jgi:hypothetical protein